jgi:hypothetical protein
MGRASKEEIAAFIAADFPQCSNTIESVGKVLVVGEVDLYSEGDEQPVAHAVGTYSIPPVGG